MRCFILLIALCLSVSSSSAWAVSESRLWLPKKLKNLMPRLLKAAELAEQRSDCLTVVRGELAQDRSKPGVPVFRIVCRNEQGLTYAMHTRADDTGDTSLDTSGPKSRFKRDWVQPIEEERGWRICLSGTRVKVAALINPQIITDPRPRPDINKLGESYFYINLNAEAISGDALEFASMCKVLPSGQFDIKVAGRKKVIELRRQNQQGEVPAIPVAEDDMLAKPMAKKTSSTNASRSLNTNKNSNKSTNKDTSKKTNSATNKALKNNSETVSGFKTEQGSRAGWQRIVPDMDNALTHDGWEVQGSDSAVSNKRKDSEQTKPSPPQADPAPKQKQTITADGWTVE